VTDQIADQTIAATSEAPAAPMSAADITKLVTDAVAAATAADRKKFNAELADRRKGEEALRAMFASRGETPKPEGGAGGGEMPKPAADPEKVAQQVYAVGRLAAKVEGKIESLNLAEEDCEKFAARLEAISSKPLSERESALTYLLEGIEIAAKREAKREDETEKKPGRDARNNGSARGAAPAVRSAEGAPATMPEWNKLSDDRQNALIGQGFDPRGLPYK
jgi:hypothetical protein